ncbi:MAG: hypothetical protein MZU91_00425 [Desulfosudis oleivorans]|nr:hypothetical protein [Desulfosudis oleivorans]
MYCGNCYTVCPALPRSRTPTGDGIAIVVGGKVVQRPRSDPCSQSSSSPSCPTSRPRWPEVVGRRQAHRRDLREGRPEVRARRRVDRTDRLGEVLRA